MWLAKITRDHALSSPNLPTRGWHPETIEFEGIAECGLFALVSGWASSYWYPGFAESDVLVAGGGAGTASGGSNPKIPWQSSS